MVPHVTPRPRALVPVIGHLLPLARDPLGTLERWGREVGDIYRVDIPGRNTWVVNRPEEIQRVFVHHSQHFIKDSEQRRAKQLLGEGLLTSEGALWKRQRRMMQPTFHKDRTAAHGDRMVEVADRFAATWATGGVRDLHADAIALTLAVVTDALFGDHDVPSDVVGESLEAVLQRFDGVRALLPSWLPFGRFARCREGIARLDGVVFDLLARRRAQPSERVDVLSALLAATDEHGAPMPDRQLRDEIVTLLIAGHETVANALTWSWHLLSTHPAAEQRLCDEVDALGGLPRAADLARLPFTAAVLSEAMRLYPPAWILSREVTADWEVAGMPAPRGMQLSMVPWIVHRDPRFYTDAQAFRPERWLDGSTASLPDYAYFPFGGGQRLCIGRQFGLLEGTLVLAVMARRYRLRAVATQPIVPVPSLTLRPKGGLPIGLSPRTARGG